MKYENAKDILPANLLEEVQKYAEGKLIYIPKSEKPKGWGEASGYRSKLNKRNAAICSRYSAGQSIMEIAEEFFLSPETIKKLVYGKKVNLPMFSPSINSAEQYASAGMGEEWVRAYLSSMDESMPDISDFFMSELVRIPIRFIETASSVESADDSTSFLEVPLIVIYDNKTFSAPYQPRYLNYLKGEKRNSHYAFVFARNSEYNFFWNNYGKHFQR
ncbi:CD3324 family protein [Butyrivibrio sp. VCD2006]|uniref:CD3324 family protein n=1 Tax=Butyrivibrio sp. VCD2006 TaxID=1280664 RepID=UPI0003FA171E|nr:CD3324 family protein [Butyrivibrio sp. VCD2006]